MSTERRAFTLAEFVAADPMLAAARQLRALGYTALDAHTPYPLPDLDAALGIAKSRIPLLVLLGGLLGVSAGYLMQWWCNAVDWPINVGGRPAHAAPSFIPITFEVGILLGAFGAFFGLFAFIGLPRLHHPLFEVAEFRSASVDRFWISVATPIEAAEQRSELEAHLTSLGATLVRTVEGGPMTTGPTPSLLLLVTVCACHPGSIDPLEQQPKYKAYSQNDFFDDHLAMRVPPEGTIAREQDFGGSLAATESNAPAGLTQGGLELGRSKYNSTCAACHGLVGDGDSIVSGKMSLEPPASLHQERLRTSSDARLYAIVTYGYGLMPRYEALLSPPERWAVVAYVRALQLSQHLSWVDAPEDVRRHLTELETGQ